ncbi:MAG: hypothetical protein QM775_05965 [Pirellulales bacterium]
MKRDYAAVVVLVLLTLIGFFAFPVTIRVGDDWQASWKRLGMVPKLDVATGVRVAIPKVMELFLLPDGTCIELIAGPRNQSDRTYVLNSISVGKRFERYPGKMVWFKDGGSESRTEFCFTGYTYPRLIAWGSAFHCSRYLSDA